MIYDIIFGKSFGKVHCPFHDGDNTASLSISSEGKFHCFACGVGGGSEQSFVQQYYNVSKNVAERLLTKLSNLPRYTYDANLSTDDINYLNSIGISPTIQKQMLRSSSGKLIYPHYYQGVEIDHTWFNYPTSVVHDPTKGKYSRDYGSVSGFLTPYKNTLGNTVVICEGEKDMLTLLSQGIPAVSIVGGCNTLPYLMQRELKDKRVVILYDCDQAGREGAEALTAWLYSIGAKAVKNVDIGLGDKEDVNDWFTKYKFTKEALLQLINATPTASAEAGASLKVLRLHRQITKQLSEEELEELITLLNNKEKESNE